MKWPTLSELKSVWSGVLKDPAAKLALDQLEKEGFKIRHLSPQDPTFRNRSWADYVAAIPLLPNRTSRRHIHRGHTLRKHRPLVKALRDFMQQLDDPFCAVSLTCTRDTDIQLTENLRDLAAGAVSFIEKFLSWDWCIRKRNPRNALIAELRWTIRHRTGRPHDRELSTLIDAACRAAGRKELCFDNSTLDRVEALEKESRVKAMGRLNSGAVSSRTLKRGPVTDSTRKPKKRR